MPQTRSGRGGENPNDTNPPPQPPPMPNGQEQQQGNQHQLVNSNSQGSMDEMAMQLRSVMEMVTNLATTVNQLVTTRNLTPTVDIESVSSNITSNVSVSNNSNASQVSNVSATNVSNVSNVSNNSKFMVAVYKRVENWPTFKGLSDTMHPMVFLNSIEQCFTNVGLTDSDKVAIIRTKLVGDAHVWVTGVPTSLSYVELRKKFIDKFWSINIQQSTYMKFLATPYIENGKQTPGEFAEHWHSKLQFSDVCQNTYAFLLTLRGKFPMAIQGLLVGECMQSYDKFRERLQEAELIYISQRHFQMQGYNQRRNQPAVNVIMRENEYNQRMGVQNQEQFAGVPTVEGNRVHRNFNNSRNQSQFNAGYNNGYHGNKNGYNNSQNYMRYNNNGYNNAGSYRNSFSNYRQSTPINNQGANQGIQNTTQATMSANNASVINQPQNQTLHTQSSTDTTSVNSNNLN